MESSRQSTQQVQGGREEPLVLVCVSSVMGFVTY